MAQSKHGLVTVLTEYLTVYFEIVTVFTIGMYARLSLLARLNDTYQASATTRPKRILAEALPFPWSLAASCLSVSSSDQLER